MRFLCFTYTVWRAWTLRTRVLNVGDIFLSLSSALQLDLRLVGVPLAVFCTNPVLFFSLLSNYKPNVWRRLCQYTQLTQLGPRVFSAVIFKNGGSSRGLIITSPAWSIFNSVITVELKLIGYYNSFVLNLFCLYSGFSKYPAQTEPCRHKFPSLSS